jgi:cyanophycin synthetase
MLGVGGIMGAPDIGIEPNKPSWLQIERTQAIPGYLFGLAQSSLLVRLRLAPSVGAESLAERWLNALAAHLPAVEGLTLVTAPRAQTLPSALRPLLEAVVGVVHRLQVAAGLTVLPEARLLGAANGHCALALPGPVPAAVGEALVWSLQSLYALAADPLAVALTEPLVNALASLQKRLSRWAPGGTNRRHFLRVAYALGIPVLALPGGVFQFGWGRRSRLFNSTITDGTGAIATAWAKNKHHTNALLRMAGLPVPAQEMVTTLEAAIAAAQRIGYPVVLKPANLDQGVGVEAGLRNEAELRLAHVRTSQHATMLLLEKHVPGDDYRINVVLGKVMGVSHRTPARVVGDGVHSVTDLVAAANRQRQAPGGVATIYKPIEVDSEALELMAREGLDENSVLSQARVLTLRRTANSSRGGSAVDVTHLVHPDNLALCVKAAALLRLDIAGLDLLITDISRSWREVGAAFCEVNAQPQTGGAHPWMFERILKRFVVGRGRVPALLVLAKAGKSPVASDIVAALEHAGLATEQVQGTAQALLFDCRAQLIVPDLGAIVVVTDGAELLRWGLPLDRFDLLVLDDCGLAETDLKRALGLLEPHIARVLATNSTPSLGALAQAWGQDRWRQLVSRQALVGEVVRRVSELADGG